MWSFVLADLAGNQIGAIDNATQRSLSLKLNGSQTASFQIRLDNPLATAITDAKGDVLLKVYNTAATTPLQFVGDCISAEESGDGSGQTLACNFSGPLWRLSKRMCTSTPSGGAFPDPSSVTFPSTNRNLIAKTLLDNANAIRDTDIADGTFDALFPVSVEVPWSFKPISEALAEFAQALAFYFEQGNVPTSLAYDDFNATFDPLAGRAAPRGGTWAEAGSTNGAFKTYGGGAALVRQTTSDNPPTGAGEEARGRFAYLSSGPYTDQFAQVDISYFGSYGQRSGVLARFNNTSPGSYLRAALALGYQSQVVVEKCVGGTLSPLSNSAYIPLTANTAYTLRLQVNAAGQWAVWLWTTGGSDPAAPILRGQDDDLKTGGSLASGKVGIWDLNTSGTANDRVYDTFLAQTPTQSMDAQGFEFELVPTEPSTGSIATLNVKERIGTDRPDVVFEYGGGNRSIKAYKRVIDRSGLTNVAYSQGDDIRVAGDTPSVNARGMFEELVSSDAQDGSLRQAYIQEYVRIRSTAREVVNFDPSPSAPQFGTDYFVGDNVTARSIVNGSVRFNGTVRVYGADVSIDENGKETVTPQLVAE